MELAINTSFIIYSVLILFILILQSKTSKFKTFCRCCFPKLPVVSPMLSEFLKLLKTKFWFERNRWSLLTSNFATKLKSFFPLHYLIMQRCCLSQRPQKKSFNQLINDFLFKKIEKGFFHHLLPSPFEALCTSIFPLDLFLRNNLWKKLVSSFLQRECKSFVCNGFWAKDSNYDCILKPWALKEFFRNY